jgi:uncharacterized membrane protein
MDLMALLSRLGPLDAGALALALLCWLAVGWLIEHPPARHPSVQALVAALHHRWMAAYLVRENHIFDAQILANLRQGTGFFASTCLLAIGGVLALIGNTAPLESVAEGIGTGPAPALLWQIKLLPVALFLFHGFLKFVWAYRIFGYGSVAMAAVPEDRAGPAAVAAAGKAADLNIRAVVNFNRGLRSMYFALAALAWLAGPWALAGAVAVVTWIVWSREFWSHARAILLR